MGIFTMIPYLIEHVKGLLRFVKNDRACLMIELDEHAEILLYTI